MLDTDRLKKRFSEKLLLYLKLKKLFNDLKNCVKKIIKWFLLQVNF